MERLAEKQGRLVGQLYKKGKEAWREGSRKCSKWWGRVERVCKEWGLGEIWVSGVVGGMKKESWEELVVKRMLRAEKGRWKRDMGEVSSKEGSKVKLYEEVKRKWGMEEYLKIGWARGSVAWKTRLRSGTCELEIEKGRGVVSREERVCRGCGREVEDVEHFVWKCTVLDQDRKAWWGKLGRELERDEAGGEVWQKMIGWVEEGEISKIVGVVLGGSGGGLICGEVLARIDIVVRNGLWRMRKVRKAWLEERGGGSRRVEGVKIGE